MNKESICFSSKTIDIAENENYLELTNRVCFYNEPNLNNVELLFDENSLTKAKTLIDMPVVAKYTTNAQGEPTFKGHEVYYDEDGNMYFGTDNIGTHTDVYIQDDDVEIGLNGETQRLPCLFAKYRIWKRNQNVIDAVKRLYSEGKLYSSWEIQTLSYTYNNGIKTLTDYVFLSNCLLGYEYAFPAYGVDAKAIQMSQKESQLLVAEAFSKDILENSVSNIIKPKKEDEILEENIEVSKVVEKKEQNTDNVQNNESPNDTKPTDTPKENNVNKDEPNKKDKKANKEKSSEEEKEEDVKSDTDIVSELNSKIAELNATIEKKNASLIEASEKIQTLTKEVSELIPYKESCEKAEQERIEKEISEKRENLKNYAVKSGFISEDEVSSVDEIKNCIDNVDEKGLKAIIAERFMKSLDNKPNVETSSISKNKVKEIETSEVKTNIVDSEDTDIDYKSVMKTFLNK